ncbi:MAG: hypothetical protein AB7F19_07875 [Candidatus Babeliales bacterium]
MTFELKPGGVYKLCNGWKAWISVIKNGRAYGHFEKEFECLQSGEWFYKGISSSYDSVFDDYLSIVAEYKEPKVTRRWIVVLKDDSPQGFYFYNIYKSREKALEDIQYLNKEWPSKKPYCAPIEVTVTEGEGL